MAVNIPLYIQYGQIGQFSLANKYAYDAIFNGVNLVPSYISLLRTIQETVADQYALSGSTTALEGLANYMVALSGIWPINTTPVATPFIIVVQPQSQTVNSGANVSFVVAVAGGTQPYSYVWRFNGTPIGGETNPTLDLTNVDSGDAGAYSCVITDANGQILTSNNAVLTVNIVAVAVFAVPLSSDPFPLIVDNYTYTYTQNVLPSANIGWNLLQSDNDVNWWIFKEPIGNTVKLSYDNGTNLPNAGPIPDQLMRTPVVLGGFRYILTRNQYSYDANQPTNLKTTP